MGLDASDNNAINLTALRYAQQVMATRWLCNYKEVLAGLKNRGKSAQKYGAE
jgi:hypothetical protein